MCSPSLCSPKALLSFSSSPIFFFCAVFAAGFNGLPTQHGSRTLSSAGLGHSQSALSPEARVASLKSSNRNGRIYHRLTHTQLTLRTPSQHVHLSGPRQTLLSCSKLSHLLRSSSLSDLVPNSNFHSQSSLPNSFTPYLLPSLISHPPSPIHMPQSTIPWPDLFGLPSYARTSSRSIFKPGSCANAHVCRCSP